MLGVEQISEWLGQEVLGSEGESLGKLDDVYYGRGKAEPQLAVVKHGLLGRKQLIVPLQGATVGRGHVRLAFTAEQIEQVASAVELDPGDSIPNTEAQQLADAYGIQISSEDLDSANATQQRAEAARDAEARAAELEAEAKERAQIAEEAQSSAREESSRATDAESAAQRARAEADRLRPATPGSQETRP